MRGKNDFVQIAINSDENEYGYENSSELVVSCLENENSWVNNS